MHAQYQKCFQETRLHALVELLSKVLLPCCTMFVISVRHTGPCSMLLAMLTMAKELHGFLFLWMHVVLFLYGYGALLGGPLSCQWQV